MAVQFEKTIRALLDEKKYQTLKDILVTMEPADIAAVFEDLEEERMPVLFRLLPKETAAETFAELDSEWQELLIRGFSDRELHEVVNELYVDDAADLVDEMPANVVKRILAQADPEMRKEINEILRYPENSAGSIMTTEYVSLRPGMTVAEAITRIRRTGVDKETIYTCYVTEGRIAAIFSISSVTSSSITSMASSKVMIPTIRPSVSTTGSARKLYFDSICATSSWSVSVLTEITFSSMISLTGVSSSAARSRSLTDTAPRSFLPSVT